MTDISSAWNASHAVMTRADNLILDLRAQLAAMTVERDRLQRIIDTRPAINVGLPESYISWSQNIYVLEARAAMGKASDA